MPGPDSPKDNYYFVPLGRERGGLFDLLGLSPDASETDVGNASANYQKKVKSTWKRKAKSLKTKMEAGEVTKEEFEEKIGQWRAESNAKLADYNDLVSKRDSELKMHRIAKREGHVIEKDRPWMNMGRALGEAPRNLWNETSRHRLIPKQERSRIKALEERAVQLAGNLSTPTNRRSVGGLKPNDQGLLRRFGELVVERDMQRLLWADRLWSQISVVNHDVWNAHVRKWRLELELTNIGFSPEPSNSCELVNMGQTSLSGTSDRSIDRLESEEIEDLSRGPSREGPGLSLAQMFEEMLGARLGQPPPRRPTGFDAEVKRARFSKPSMSRPRRGMPDVPEGAGLERMKELIAALLAAKLAK